MGSVIIYTNGNIYKMCRICYDKNTKRYRLGNGSADRNSKGTEPRPDWIGWADILVKYKEIASFIISKIEEGELKKGDRLSTEEELQEQFGVSRQTIRNSLKILEDDGYISRQRGSGSYVTWENIPKERTIGVMIGYMSPYIYPDIVRGIDQVLASKGYGIDLGFSHYSLEYERKYLQRMLDMNVSGVIIEGVNQLFQIRILIYMRNSETEAFL